MDRCLHRPTPSKHPYRPFAAAEAAADRHRVASTAARLLRGYYEATTRATATRLLQATTRLLAIRLLPGYYQATTRPLPGYYQATTRLLPGAARATWPAAPQQQPSSSAGAAQCSSSEPAPTIRTQRERSRGGRSPRAEQAGQLRSPRTPHVVEQQGVVGVHASLHNRPCRRARARRASRTGPGTPRWSCS